jgi:hypothetical protein
MFMARQGDVLIVETPEVPTGEPLPLVDGRAVLAYGEVTGHHHSIAANGGRALLFKMGDDMLLSIPGGAPVDLTHQEHSTIKIPAGNYRITIQKEYSPEAIRNVAD